MSSAVNIPTTPSSFRASEISIDLITALGCSVLTAEPYIIPSILISAAYWAVPNTFDTASVRGIFSPTAPV